MDKSSIFLESQRFFLSKVSIVHVTKTYLEWLHDQDVNHFLESGKTPSSIDELKSFVKENNSLLFLAIHDKENNYHIGNIKIDSFNAIHRTAEYGIMIGDKSYWGKGVANEISKIILEHCFNVLNIRKITLGVIGKNKKALNLYEKLGFETEGILKNHVFVNGEYLNVYRMAIFQKLYIDKK